MTNTVRYRYRLSVLWRRLQMLWFTYLRWFSVAYVTVVHFTM